MGLMSVLSWEQKKVAPLINYSMLSSVACLSKELQALTSAPATPWDICRSKFAPEMSSENPEKWETASLFHASTQADKPHELSELWRWYGTHATHKSATPALSQPYPAARACMHDCLCIMHIGSEASVAPHHRARALFWRELNARFFVGHDLTVEYLASLEPRKYVDRTSEWISELLGTAHFCSEPLGTDFRSAGSPESTWIGHANGFQNGWE